MPDNTLSTLEQIQTKVRRLTRSPSENQLSTDDIDDYINTFVLYDFPEHLRLFNLRTDFTFFAQPYVDTYSTNTTDPTSPFYNFLNTYISVHPPVFIAGYQSPLSQDRSKFFSAYPMINFVASIGTTGDGTTTAFSGTLSSVPVLQNQVTFVSIDGSNNGITLMDVPQNASTGILVVPDNLSVSYGTINYVTGAYTINFPVAPGQGQPINSQTVPYVQAIPQAVLYYDNTFTLRPVPDQPYRITMEAYIRPTELLSSDQMPKLSEWWQYIAYGAAKKIFEDRMDIDSVQLILPEFKKQESLILRRTLVQYTNERVATIYTEQNDFGNNNNNFGNGNV